MIGRLCLDWAASGVGVVGGVMIGLTVGGGLIMEGLIAMDGNMGGVGKWRTNMTSEGSSS